MTGLRVRLGVRLLRPLLYAKLEGASAGVEATDNASRQGGFYQGKLAAYDEILKWKRAW